jgi:hypothetical protein
MWMICPFIIFAQEHKTPEQITSELDEAERDLNQAEQMFNPWYTGPLVTPSASLVAPGHGVVQPYLIVTDNYQFFNQKRESITIPNQLMQLTALSVFQFGVTNSVDMLITPSGGGQWQAGEHGGGFGDLPVTIGFLINRQTLYTPQIKFTIQEKFPTGKYQHLNRKNLGLSGFGGGAFQTQFGLSFGKIVNWTSQHPINTRLFLGYNIATLVDVEGLNAYGGGRYTSGIVQPGNIFTVDGAVEISITQRWVAALDIVYVAKNSTKFHGFPGYTATGALATVGNPSNDNLSLAPAIEYNWNGSFGLVTGVQFSVYGRNSFNFVSGQFSVYYYF